MSRIAVCITTAARPEMLARCLESIAIAVQAVNYAVTVIVVDNDPAESARQVVDAHEGSMSLIYARESQRGIPYGRNRCLATALTIGPEYLVFVDDDMTVSATWLERLVSTIEESAVDVVTGGVINVYRDGTRAPKYLPRMDNRTVAETDNVLFKRWIAEGVRFDERLADSGGSDTLFFRQAHALGAKIRHAEQAVAHEYLHSQRGSWSWFLRRNYRYGLVGVTVERLLQTAAVSVRFVIRGVAAVALGVFEAVFLGWRSDPTRSFGMYRVARGVGMLVGAMGRRAKSYF